MSKKIKYGITGLVSLLVLFTLIIIAVPHFADANLFRSQIINAAQKATGRDVTINGNLQWAFFPAFSIEADQVTLANPAGFADKNALASIDQLKLSVEILPFILSKTVILDEVELKGANIHLITLANGQTNWQDLLTKPANTKNTANTATTNDTSKSSAVNFNVDKFLLENSQLTWDDQQQNQRWELSELNVSTHAFSLGSTFPLTISTKAQHPPSGQIFTLDLQTDANINPEKNTYTLNAVKVNGGIQDNATAPVQKIDLTLDTLQIDPATKQLTLNKMVFDGFGTHATGGMNAEHNGQHPIINGDFKLDQLLLGKLKITDIDLPVKGQQGTYTFQPVTSKLYGGNLNGNVSLNFANNIPQWNVNYQLTDLQTQTLFADVFGYDRFTGTGNSSGQLTTSGLDSNSILQSLAGTLQVQLTNGSLVGVDLSYWWQVGNKLLNADTSALTLADHKSTKITSMSSSFNFNKGMGTTNNFQLYNDVLFVKGTGQVDMVRKYVNMTLYVSENKNGQPSGTAIPLIMSGSFDNITVRPDEKTIAAMAAKIITSKLGQAATKAIGKKIPGELAKPLNNAVNKLLGQ